MKSLIIQVARLDRNYREKINFQCGDISSDGYSVTSKFFKEKVLKNECEILFLFPLSLPIQNFNDTNDEYLQKCELLDINEYLKNYNPIASEHPHLKNNKFLVIPSIGIYRKNGKEYIFDSNLETITLRILNHLIANYIDNINELYVDISGGQNIYNTSVLMAIQNFLPIYELKNSFNKKLKTQILYPDPILPGTKSANINLSDFNVNAAFELPYKVNDNKIQNFIQNNSESTKKNAIIYFYNVYLPLLYYSIKNGFVLLMLHVIKVLNEKEFQPLRIENKPIIIDKNYKTNYDEYIKIYHANALFDGIMKEMKEFTNDSLLFNFNQKCNTVEILESEKYKNIFNKFGLLSFNSFINELNSFVKNIDLSKLNSDINVTHDFFKNDIKINKSFKSRNFIAHNGLEFNSISLKLISKNDNIYSFEIKQKQLDIKQLKKIIKDPKNK